MISMFAIRYEKMGDVQLFSMFETLIARVETSQ